MNIPRIPLTLHPPPATTHYAFQRQDDKMATFEIDICAAKPRPKFPGPEHTSIITMIVSQDRKLSELKDAVLSLDSIRKFHNNQWQKDGVYVECIRRVADGGEEENGFFLEDKHACRDVPLSNVGKLVLWRKNTIDEEVKNITDFVSENTGFVGKLTDATGGATFFRKFSETTTGVADAARPVYFQHLLFARKAMAQAKADGNSVVKSVKIGTGFLTNWMGLTRSQI